MEQSAIIEVGFFIGRIVIAFIILYFIFGWYKKGNPQKQNSSAFIGTSIFSILIFLLTIYLVYVPMIFHTTDLAGPGFAFIGLAPLQFITSAVSYIAYRRLDAKEKWHLVLLIVSVLPAAIALVLLGRAILLSLIN